MKISTRRAALSIISFIASILMGEVCLEVFAPVPDPYADLKRAEPNQYIKSEFPPNSHFLTEPEEGLRGVSPHNLFTTNNMGFRGDYLTTPKPKDEFRVFIVGGSTTECFYLDDAKALSRALQDRLGGLAAPNITIKVYGAGKSGDASDDHVSMIVHRIVHLEPDLIVLFAGVNDLTRSIYDYDYLHYPRTQKNDTSTLFRWLATQYQIPRRLYYLERRFFPTEKQIREAVTLKSGIKNKIRLGDSAPISADRPKADTRAYANNLRTIIGAGKANSVQLVFMTQPSTWNSSVDPETKEWHAMLYRNGVKYREDFMDQALESFNDQMRTLAKEHSIPLYDLAGAIPKSLEFFYDDVHLNERGAFVTATNLADIIGREHLVRLNVSGK